MEIKSYRAALGAYTKAGSIDAEAKKMAQKTQTAPAIKNTDKVEFSAAASQTVSNAVDTSKQAIAKELRQDASPERIDKLRTMIGEGKYSVSSDSLANAIVDGLQTEG